MSAEHDEMTSEEVEQAGEFASTEPPATGNPAVDGVVAGVVGLEGRPVDEHVEVFERAHERLRAALDGRIPTPAPGASAD